MVVRFQKCDLKIDEIRKEEISSEKFIGHEKEVIRLIQLWASKRKFFEFKTSGSTGLSRNISIKREKIEYSVKTTMDKLDPHGEFRSSLLCINPSMIGGAMVVFRALARNLDLKVIPVNSTPFAELRGEEKYDLVSLVPLQMQSAQLDQLDKFKAILVGGSIYQGTNYATTAKIYSTFGMTETVSHFALKENHQDYYECIGDIMLEKRADRKLKVKGTITDHKWLITNDLIDFISPVKFNWIGRSDFTINSGGVKINPELVEAKLKSQIEGNFIISSLQDNQLGNKVILVIEGKTTEKTPDFSNLEKYEKPKQIHFLSEFEMTSSAKIDRIGTRRKLLSKVDKG